MERSYEEKSHEAAYPTPKNPPLSHQRDKHGQENENVSHDIGHSQEVDQDQGDLVEVERSVYQRAVQHEEVTQNPDQNDQEDVDAENQVGSVSQSGDSHQTGAQFNAALIDVENT